MKRAVASHCKDTADTHVRSRIGGDGKRDGDLHHFWSHLSSFMMLSNNGRTALNGQEMLVYNKLSSRKTVKCL